MTPEQEEQVERLFHTAIALQPSERRAFLAEACGADEAVCRAVERLLGGHERAEGFLDAPVWEAAATIAAESDGAMIGERLSHYHLLSLLGRGGMGEVYLARDERLERQVAIKLLPAEFIADAEWTRRFEREARTASALNHPNIITIYEIGETVTEAGELRFIVAEFIEGRTLRERMKESRLDCAAALEVAVQVAGALKAAHSAGIVHRDIKPENVMLRPDGLVKVLDFGIAKLGTGNREWGVGSRKNTLLPASDSYSLFPTPHSPLPTPHPSLSTLPGTVMGTISYMSPEQARGEEVDARTDIFSFGAMLYEMLAGRLPFEGASASAVIARILKAEPAPLAEGAREIPRELERIVNRALRKDRDERYANGAELLADLQTLKRGMEKKTGSRKWQWLGASAAFILLTLAGAAYFFRPGPGGETAINSVAVLPFAGSGEAEYLADGVTESLINSLSQSPGLKVIARGSSFKYKNSQADPREIAKALDVEALLTGSVRQNGDRLAINIELINARDLKRVWGEQYERQAAELPLLQTEMAAQAARQLRAPLTAAAERQLAKRQAGNQAAYELVLRGRFFRGKGTTEGRRKALECLQQAVAIDPNYALAWADLSNVWHNLANAGELDPQQALPRALDAAERALRLDADLPEARYSLAYYKLYRWEWAAAAREFQRAFELNPNMARAYFGYAYLLVVTGRAEAAIAAALRARELDPVSLSGAIGVGEVSYYAHQYDRAITSCRRTLELDQEYSGAHFYIGLSLAAQGRYQEAIAAYQQAVKLAGNPPYLQIYLGAAYAKSGARAKAEAIRRRLQTSGEYVSPAEFAILLAAMGEKEAAFQSLSRAYAAHDFQLQYLKVDPGFDPLRSDPRFQDLLRKIGLAP
ncbi:MAG: Serine/threonine-protein kinase PknD [Acidobacteria bacterium]|nr:Serine/threonine-protein kinase PknD [Acidobacteriota bacterium]